eukprot:scaffold30121_cov170-Skeletonema_marinoi.AAC.1
MNWPLLLLLCDFVMLCDKSPPNVSSSMMTIIRRFWAISPVTTCTIGFHMENGCGMVGGERAGQEIEKSLAPYGNEKIDFDLSQTALACAHHILQLRMNC